MYTVKGDDIVIYSDVSATESRKAVSPKLTLKDSAAGSLSITLPPGNAGYDSLKLMTSEIIVYRDNEEIWAGRIVTEDRDFQNNRVLTCEGELAYLNDTIQPQKKYEEGTTVGEFLEELLENHNKRYTDERYKFYVDNAYIYNYNDTIDETVTDYENTLDCINTKIVKVFDCHMSIKNVEGKKYIKLVKEEATFNENTQVIRFGDNLLDFTKNWDLTDMGTVLVPRGAVLETTYEYKKDKTDTTGNSYIVKEIKSTEDSDALDTYVTLSDILRDVSIPELKEVGEYKRDADGKLDHDDDGNLIYVQQQETDESGNPIYKYKKDDNGYFWAEITELSDGSEVPTIRVKIENQNEDEETEITYTTEATVEFLEYDENGNGTVTSKIVTDGVYADVYLLSEDGELYSLATSFGRVEKVVEFSSVEDSVELIKQTRDYVKEHRFDQVSIEISAVDLRYLSDKYEPIHMLDRVRCISHPHAMDDLFTVTELSIQLDKADGAQYTMQKSIENVSNQALISSDVSYASSEIESSHSDILTKAQSTAAKIIRESTNGYVSLVTDSENGKHSEALVISSGQDYTKSEHFWMFNINGLGHYTEYAGSTEPTPDSDDIQKNWGKYTLNLGLTMDGAIVANRVTTGHMSADRVRTGALVSQDGNVIWNLNATPQDISWESGTYTYTYTDEKGNEKTETIVVKGGTEENVGGGHMIIKKGQITLGTGGTGDNGSKFSVNDNGELKAEYGIIGGFTIEKDNIHNSKMTLNNEGLILKNSSDEMGRIGTTFLTNEDDKKVLVMNLEYGYAGIGWGVREGENAGSYSAVLFYANDDYEDYEAENFYMHRHLDLTGHTLKNANISGCSVNGGLSGQYILLKPDAIKSDGTIDVNSNSTRTVTIQNGIIMA